MDVMLDMTSMFGEPRAGYSNALEFVGNSIEIRLVFYLGSPSGHRHKTAEVIMAPLVAKALSRLLPERIKDWEKENGFINMPEDKDLLEGLFQVKLQPEPPPPEAPDAD
jgi:hypothetical protein